ncbi:MAG: DUF111 family protein [Erysipelotrichaceae bacterium]|nr:DUF111 family protein [Erysipelotrichaceae bacterium]
MERFRHQGRETDGHLQEYDLHAHTESQKESERKLEIARSLFLKARNDILEVCRLIGEAEAKVHDSDIEHIHFHEVGTMDAIADVTAASYLIDKLGVDKIIASPRSSFWGCRVQRLPLRHSSPAL